MQAQSPYRIESQQFNVKLKKRYLKIFNLLPADSDTFVFLGLPSVGSNVLVHVDQNGGILYQYKFSKPVDSIAMIDKDTAVALQTRLNCILVFNLTLHTFIEIPFMFMNEESDQSFVQTFANTKHICLVQNGRYNDSRLKLSYFQYPLNQGSQPFLVYQSDSEWNYEYVIRKGNEDSMILWYKVRNDQDIEIKTYTIQQKNDNFTIHKIKNEIGIPYGEQGQVQLAITTAWQLEPNKLLLVCASQKTNLQLKNKEGLVNNNFVWDLTTNQFREAKFVFPQKYHDFLIDCHSFGQFSVFRTFFFQNGIVESSPCYYIHNKSQKIVTSDLWECSYKCKLEYPTYDRVIIEGEYQNQDVDEFKVRSKRCVQK